jgi:uncharacterized membrane protein
MIKVLYGVLLAFFGAILVHIAIIFLIPRLDAPSLAQQLQTLNQARDPLIISGNAGELALSGIDPFFRYRICFYDLEEGPFQLFAIGDVPFFSAALLAENGDVMFSITDRQTINRTLNLEVRPQSDRQLLSQPSNENTSTTSAFPVFVSSSKGYAIVRAFMPDKSWTQITDKFLNNVVCQTNETEN